MAELIRIRQIAHQEFIFFVREQRNVAVTWGRGREKPMIFFQEEQAQSGKRS